MSIKVFSKMELSENATLTLDQAVIFPVSPKLGTQAIVDGLLYYYSSIGGEEPMWIPVGNKRLYTSIVKAEPALEWVLTHALDTFDILVTLYDTNNNMIDAPITINDANTITVSFTSPKAGKAVIFGASIKYAGVVSPEELQTKLENGELIVAAAASATSAETSIDSEKLGGVVAADYAKADLSNVVSGTSIKTINSTSVLGSGDLALLTSTNPSITGSITEQVYNLTGTAISPANGTIQYKTVSANTTFTESLTTGQSILLRLVNANSYTITFPTITWVGAVAPELTANCAIVIWKEQTTLYGAFVGTLV